MLLLLRVLFDINQCLAGLLELVVKILQLSIKSVSQLARLLCLPGKLLKVLLSISQDPLRPILF